MTKWLLSCGDALIDFVPVMTTDGSGALRPVVGGSCINIPIAMSRLGARAGYIGGLATDMYGQMIADHAEASKVSLDFADRFDAQTTLAFVKLVDGHAKYAFYDQATAARMWQYQPERFPWSEIAALHVGSTTLIEDPTSSETLALVRGAKGKTTLSFDPNCRPGLVEDIADYRRRMADFATCADLIRLSDEDFAYLYGDTDEGEVAARLLDNGAKLVVLTRGGEGAVAWHSKAGVISIAAPKVTVADTIGAGDTFLGSLLVALQERDGLEDLAKLTEAKLRESLEFAARCAAITCSRPGANPPWREEVGA
ncbi:carbohydrate kinase [Lacibacterium aquatile]|uniref:Carbohydrate kinase n=1 Tax=Lacibacterium aquatile TaxID=1168082 RepID=A0ABW5DUP9_9PROT